MQAGREEHSQIPSKHAALAWLRYFLSSFACFEISGVLVAPLILFELTWPIHPHPDRKRKLKSKAAFLESLSRIVPDRFTAESQLFRGDALPVATVDL